MVTKTVDNKQRIKCAIDQRLADDTAYTLTLDHAAYPLLRSDVTFAFKTEPRLVAADYAYISNTESCVYFSTPLTLGSSAAYGFEKYFETVPASPIRSVMKNNALIYDETGKSMMNTVCKDIEGKTAYIIGTRFTPHVSYTLRAKVDFEDALGNHLAQPFEKKGIVA